MSHPLIKLRDDQKGGLKRGICSICSAHPFVIEAAFQNAAQSTDYVLIEATANQVNQFGGYTGMRPADFKNFVYGIAQSSGFDTDRIILGGDHLGPFTWQSERSETAMRKAKELVYEYVISGYTKIHIDTSFPLGGDDLLGFNDRIIAHRCAQLVETAQTAFDELRKTKAGVMPPVYVVGSEVPTPGGSHEEADEEVRVTKSDEFIRAVQIFREEFIALGLEAEWEQVIAFVIQPGVEFGDERIDYYNREKSKNIINALKEYPNIVFEGHSTDYQTPQNLKNMVEDGIAILKVGPALTFALREALFALNNMEEELLAGTGVYLSDFKRVLESAMLKDQRHWLNHYRASAEKLHLKRRYSFFDRSRYYLSVMEVESAVKRLIRNLSETDIPISLISQYMPMQYKKIKVGQLQNEPKALIIDKLKDCLADYNYAANAGAL